MCAMCTNERVCNIIARQSQSAAKESPNGGLFRKARPLLVAFRAAWKRTPLRGGSTNSLPGPCHGHFSCLAASDLPEAHHRSEEEIVHQCEIKLIKFLSLNSIGLGNLDDLGKGGPQYTHTHTHTHNGQTWSAEWPTGQQVPGNHVAVATTATRRLILLG